MNELTYNLPGTLGVLIITADTLGQMLAHRQSGWFSKEAGGQLFASFEENRVRIVEATGPRKKDKRGRFSFWPHRPSEQKEITDRYKKAGLHFIGDWHTHPERIPHPSGSDTESVTKMFEASDHDLFGALLVVIGTDDPPSGLYVGLCDGEGLHELALIDEQNI